MKSVDAPRPGLKSLLCLGLMLAAAGCGTQLPLLPNSDPALRKKPSEFSADALLRHPFKADAPSGGEAQGRAAVDYGSDFVEIANFSDEDWNDVEVWLDRRYVVFVPHIAKNAPRVTTLNFWMFYDERGHAFPTDNSLPSNRIHEVELYRLGKIYSLKLQLAD